MSKPIDGLAVVRLDDLAEIVRAAVRAEIEQMGGAVQPRPLDRAEIAGALGCSTAQIDRMRTKGMPCILLGDSPRYFVSECVQWARERAR
jgi:hypothetical protein